MGSLTRYMHGWKRGYVIEFSIRQHEERGTGQFKSDHRDNGVLLGAAK
jgi:hypothetical protein